MIKLILVSTSYQIEGNYEEHKQRMETLMLFAENSPIRVRSNTLIHSSVMTIIIRVTRPLLSYCILRTFWAKLRAIAI